MLRIKLFGLFIAYAMVALVRPRKCLELLEAADRGVARTPRDPGLEKFREIARAHRAARECTLPPAGWRCTRRAGHDGPCAAVAK